MQPTITILDGYTLNPGDLSWSAIEALGRCAIYDRTAPDEIIPRAQQSDAVLINKVEMGRRVITALPRLRYIGVMATGYDEVDLAAANERGITVTNAPSYSTESVAQFVFAHLLNLVQPVALHADAVRRGRWSQAPDWCFWDAPLIELAGLTMGIVGCGQIGHATARLAHAFGMRVVAHRGRYDPALEFVQFVDLDPLFRESDVVSLHCPLTHQTTRLVNRQRLALMRPTSYLINTSRGGLVDEAALAEALNAGRLAGAGLDALAVEPPLPTNPLLSARNCHITPHIAWATRAARHRLMDIVATNLAAFLAGEPVHVVSKV
jgi:glycerate dehydrogenase